MRKIVLGKTGLEVSAVGFGGIPIQRVSDDEAVEAIHRAMGLGVNFIDTAAGYGDSQKKIGKAIRGKRDGLVIATKTPAGDRDGAMSDIEQALREMGCETIDLLQFHGVSSREKWERILAPGGAGEAFLEAREKGWVRHIGVTSHSLELSLELVDEELFETLQFPFNLVTSEPAEALIPKVRRLGKGFIVMKPLCGGQYDDANLAFKYLNAYPDLVPIPGVEMPEQIEEICSIVAGGQTLAGEEKARAEQIAAELGKEFCRRCGYCEPCPQGVPIRTAMILDGFLSRFPERRLVDGPVSQVAEKVPQCTRCGTCETKCPYDLRIIEKIHESLDTARAYLAEHT